MRVTNAGWHVWSLLCLHFVCRLQVFSSSFYPSSITGFTRVLVLSKSQWLEIRKMLILEHKYDSIIRVGRKMRGQHQKTGAAACTRHKSRPWQIWHSNQRPSDWAWLHVMLRETSEVQQGLVTLAEMRDATGLWKQGHQRAYKSCWMARHLCCETGQLQMKPGNSQPGRIYMSRWLKPWLLPLVTTIVIPSYLLWQHANNVWNRGLEYSSLAEHLSSISETLCLIPRTTKILLSWLVFIANSAQSRITWGEGVSTERLFRWWVVMSVGNSLHCWLIWKGTAYCRWCYHRQVVLS